MLQVNKRRAVEGHEAGDYRNYGGTEPEATAPAAVIEAFFRVVRRQFATVALISVLIIALGVLYLLVTPLTFKAEATMLLDRGKFLDQPRQQLFSETPVDNATIESELEILKSDDIARAVIRSLHLIEVGEFGASSGIVQRLVSVVHSGVNSVVNFLNPSPPGSEADIAQWAVPTFKSRLAAQRIGGSFIIAVTFKSHNAERAAQIANAVVDAYINYQLQAKFDATHRANLWLQNRLNDLAAQTAAADKAVSEFKAKHNIVSTGTGRSLTDLQLADRNTKLLEAQAQVTTAQVRLDQIEGVFTKNDVLDDTTAFATVAETLTNPVIVHLRTKYVELVAREADWSKRYGANHLAVVNLRTQIHEIL